MALNGFDISHYQTGLNFWGIANIDFLICKATEGTTFKDNKFNDYILEAVKRNKLIGGYHVLTGTDSIMQAQYLHNMIQTYDGTIVPIVDIEPNYSGNAAGVESFVREYYRLTKVYPWVYINLNMLKNYNLVNDYVKKHCGIWLAGYPEDKVDSFYTINNLPTSYQNTIKNYTFVAWQFTSRFKGNKLDGDIAFLSSSQWLEYAQGDRQKNVNNTSINNNATVTGNKWILARKVIDGLYGNGVKRKMALGTRYNEIQACVNILLTESDTQLASRVIKGEFGNGNQRKEILGSRYKTIQAIVNKRM